ncbi:MAG: TolC family protein [Polyangiaceae bacterium]
MKKAFGSVALFLTLVSASAAAQSASQPAPVTPPALPPAVNGENETSVDMPSSAPLDASRTITLAQVERAALAQQPQVVSARALTAAAEARAREVRAPLLPQVVGTAEYLRETGNFAPRPGAIPNNATSGGGSSLTTSYDFWQFGVTANQLIYDFGQTWGKWRAAEATADAQSASENALKLQTLFNVRRAYFNARAEKALVVVAKETLDNEKKHLVQIQGFVTVGTHPEIDLVQARTVLANAQVAYINAQNNYDVAKAQLNQAAGLFDTTEYDVGDEEAPPVPDEDQSLDILVSRAIAARPELAQIEKQRVAQQKTLSALKGGYGPALSATAGATENGVALDGLVPNWDVGLILSWPIFQGGLTRAQVDEAAANLDSVDAQKAVVLLQVRLDVEQARLAVRAAKASLGATEDAVTNGKEQLRLAESRYTTGVGSIIELSDAQVAYASAEAQAVQARYGLATARVQLLAALGRP